MFKNMQHPKNKLMQNWFNSHLLEVQQGQVEYYHKSCSWFSRQTCLKKKREIWIKQRLSAQFQVECNHMKHALAYTIYLQCKCSFHIECHKDDYIHAIFTSRLQQVCLLQGAINVNLKLSVL